MTISRRDLAVALGISEAQLSRLVKRGMPDDSIERAVRWRRRHLELARRKRSPAELAEPDSVVTARRMGEQLAQQLPAAPAASEVEALRAALRTVPQGLRAYVRLPAEVWDVLAAGVAQGFSPGEDAAPLSEADAEEMGHFWYAALAGEVIVHEGSL